MAIVMIDGKRVEFNKNVDKLVADGFLIHDEEEGVYRPSEVTEKIVREVIKGRQAS